MRKKKPPTAPPTMGTMLLEDDFEVWLCEAAAEVGKTITVGGGLEVVVIVTTVTTPLFSVDDCSSVTTVGGGVVVITTVVGVYWGIDGDGEGCGVVEGEDCSNVVEGVVFIGAVEQLAKRVEVGSTTVTMVVMIRGTVSVETVPSGWVCTITVEVVMTFVDVVVEKRVRVGIGRQTAMRLWYGGEPY